MVNDAAEAIPCGQGVPGKEARELGRDRGYHGFDGSKGGGRDLVGRNRRAATIHLHRGRACLRYSLTLY